jgi:NhaP-type Na+/H+ or K+/H+ antiporter
MLGYLAEAFVFSYLGLAFFTYTDYDWSWQFSLLMFFIIIIGRYIGTTGLIFFMTLFGHKKDVTWR